MAKRILVPLDQTLRAESIVPVVADAARGGGASVRLLHVAPVPDTILGEDGRVVAYADQEMARLEAEGLDYLRTIEAQLDGVAVESVVRFGDPVKEILGEANAWEADLVAVTADSKSRLPRRLLGGVAHQMLRKAPLAVMVLRPPREAAA